MRVLLDEMLPRKLKRLLPEGAEVVTVQERGWDSEKNGELLASAEKEFAPLLTIDRGVSPQQDLSRFDLTVVVPTFMSNRLPDLEPRMEEVRRLWFHHFIYQNTRTGKRTSVSRHTEVDNTTAHKICGQLGVPPPPQRRAA